MSRLLRCAHFRMNISNSGDVKFGVFLILGVIVALVARENGVVVQPS